MYNLHLSAEQLEIRDTVRDFVTQEIKPVALKPTRLEPHVKPLLTDVLEQASRLGLRTLALSEELGGTGADALTRCIVTEELAAGDPDIAAVLAQTSSLAGNLFNPGVTQGQRDRFLTQFLQDDRYHLALADQEPDQERTLGINYHRPEIARTGFQTIATRAGDEWIINGQKVAVANAPVAELFAVLADADGAVRMFLVPRDTPGLSVTDDGPHHRNYHGVRGTVTLSDCRVPADHLLAATPHAAQVERSGTLQDSAMNLGIGRAAYEAALEYAQLRVQGGRRSSSTRRSERSSPRSRSGSKSRARAIWQAAWAADHPEALPTAACPTCRLRGSPRSSPPRRSMQPRRTPPNASAPWA